MLRFYGQLSVQLCCCLTVRPHCPIYCTTCRAVFGQINDDDDDDDNDDKNTLENKTVENCSVVRPVFTRDVQRALSLYPVAVHSFVLSPYVRRLLRGWSGIDNV